MNTDSNSNIPLLNPVSLLGTASLQPIGGTEGTFIGEATATVDAEIVVLISFDASNYPLEDHCRYALHSEKAHPYTYPNFRFEQKPPGLRVGPWPGWRGIPLMPSARLKAGDKETELQFQIWGDEFQKHSIRAVAKIKSLPAEQIIVTVSDPRLVPLEAQYYSVRTLKPTLPQFEIPNEILRRHPRLLINENELQALRNDKTAARLEAFRRIHDLLPRWDSTLVVTPESKLPKGPESLAPEDKVLIGAFLALIEPASVNVERGVKSLLDYCTLTEQPDFGPLTIDTQAGETLFILCVGYDWLHPHLNTHNDKLIRKRLWDVADVCWNHLGYERDDYAQAHYLGCGMGLLAFSLLFWDLHMRAHEWGTHLAGVLKLVLSMLPEDGYYPHGINLWIYEFGFLLRWLELLRATGGPDLWDQTSALSHASAFRAAATSPDGLHGVTFGDAQYRVGGDSWCHYLISARTGSGEARWLGDFLRESPMEGVDFRSAPARRRVYEYLWLPEHVQPVPSPDGISLFRDGTQVFARTQDSLFTFRSGPPLGIHRLQAGINGGYGHSDPGSGSILFYDKGASLIAGPGPVYRRDTSLHNVVTINGQGQVGDSAVWMPDFVPPSHHAKTFEIATSGKTLAASVDLASSYLPHLGVRSMRRSIFVTPGRSLLGVDVITIAKISDIEWNIHSCAEFTHLEDHRALKFRVGSKKGPAPVLACASSNALTWKTGLSEFVPAYPNDGMRNRFLRVTCREHQTVFVWCLTLDDDVPEIQLLQDKHAKWVFREGASAEFDGTWITLGEKS